MALLEQAKPTWLTGPITTDVQCLVGRIWPAGGKRAGKTWSRGTPI
jgi:hypothetical protein